MQVPNYNNYFNDTKNKANSVPTSSSQNDKSTKNFELIQHNIPSLQVDNSIKTIKSIEAVHHNTSSLEIDNSMKTIEAVHHNTSSLPIDDAIKTIEVVQVDDDNVEQDDYQGPDYSMISDYMDESNDVNTENEAETDCAEFVMTEFIKYKGTGIIL